MISTIRWVPRSAFRQQPVVEDHEVEMEDKEVEIEGKEVEPEEEESFKPKKLDENGLPEGIMDDYDDEETGIQDSLLTSKEDLSAVFKDNMKLNAEGDDEDPEDLEIKKDDKVFIVANSEDDYSGIEVQVYDGENNNFFVHHEITIPSFPLCLTHIAPTGVENNGNYVAVGSFSPIIEIWDLDVMNVMEPVAALSLPEVVDEFDFAIMCMDYSSSSNEEHLITGDSQSQIHLWDLKKSSIVRTFKHHKDKIQSVRFSTKEPHVILSGSFDKTLTVFDSRENNPSLITFPLTADCEAAEWAMHNPFQIVAASEDGKVSIYDLRNAEKAVTAFRAHKASCGVGDIALNERGLLASCASDELLKVWDLNQAKPTKVLEKAMQVGELFTVDFCPDNDLLLAAGGDQSKIALWDISEEEGIKGVF